MTLSKHVCDRLLQTVGLFKHGALSKSPYQGVALNIDLSGDNFQVRKGNLKMCFNFMFRNLRFQKAFHFQGEGCSGYHEFSGHFETTLQRNLYKVGFRSLQFAQKSTWVSFRKGCHLKIMCFQC